MAWAAGMTSTAGTVTAGSTSATTGGMGAAAGTTSTAEMAAAGSTAVTTGGMGAAAGTTSTAGMAAAGSTAAMAGGTEAAAGTRTATQARTTAGKRLTPPKTTSCKKQKKKDTGSVRIGVGKCIKIKHSDLFHELKSKAQQHCLPKDVANSYPYFGTVVKGGGTKSANNKGWDYVLMCFHTKTRSLKMWHG